MKNVMLQNHFLVAQSMAASFTTSALAIVQSDMVGLQLNYATGSSPVGVVSVEGSIDHAQDSQGNVLNAGNWFTMYLSVNGAAPAASIAIPGNSTPIFVDLGGSSAPYIRVKYTRTSGSSTMDGYSTYKRLGD